MTQNLDSSKLINASNVSEAWFKALKHLNECSNGENTSLKITIMIDGDPYVDPFRRREKLEKLLISKGKFPVQTVAETIFPKSMLRKRSMGDFFAAYKKNLPIIKNVRQNRKGTYFERIIDFNGDGKLNQLEDIIMNFGAPDKESKIKRTQRRSYLQLAIYDPIRDKKNQPFQQFPCLQQIAFTKLKREPNKLIMSAFYPHQYIIEKAYGNYVGLIDLGLFVASNLNLQLCELNCYIGLGSICKSGEFKAKELHDLIKDCEKIE